MSAFKEPEQEFHNRKKEAKNDYDSDSKSKFIKGDIVDTKNLTLKEYTIRTKRAPTQV